MTPADLPFQLLLLLGEALLLSGLLVLLFWLRRWLGYAPLYVAVGSFQFVQVVLSLAIYVPITESVAISPGSIVLLPATIFAVLLVYLAEDAPEARKLIYSVVLANVALTVLGLFFAGHVPAASGTGPLELTSDLFRGQARVMLAGTMVLLVDVVLAILVYEALSKVVRGLFWRLLFSGWIVLWFDTVAFVTASFLGDERYGSILLSGLAGKTVAATLYAGVLAAYVTLKGVRPSGWHDEPHELRDVFRALTYKQRYEEVLDLAFGDPLTGLYNRRAFQDALEREAERYRRYRDPLALLLVDVDHFKSVNDRFGHAEGDRALEVIASAIEGEARAADVACRIGGEEFAVVAPRASREAARGLAERIRVAVAERIASADPPLSLNRLTVTVGVASFPEDHETSGLGPADALFKIADRRLYRGKNEGRDQVVVSDPVGAPAPELTRTPTRPEP